jgi:hypothetical protein
MASYKRNQYKYVPGHYQKSEVTDLEVMDSSLTQQNKSGMTTPIKSSNKDGVNFNSVANSAIGNLAADSLSYGIKKVFAPNSLPATKEDVLTLQKEINHLKLLLKVKTS